MNGVTDLDCKDCSLLLDSLPVIGIFWLANETDMLVHLSHSRVVADSNDRGINRTILGYGQEVRKKKGWVRWMKSYR
jgi:hypothetical protein